MSNLSTYSLIDDDHIDDQETINVGNLIEDLESSLEKEKIENEQAHAKPINTCTTSITNLPSSSSSSSASFSSYVTKASSSTSTIASSSMPSGKINQKSSSKHSNVSSINNTIINSNNSINNNLKNSINISSSGVGPGCITNSNNGHILPTKSVFKTSADERGELKMRITRETKPGKSEHKIVTSPNQKSPTSFSGSSNSSSSSSSGNSNKTNNSRNTIIINNSTPSHANNCEKIGSHESTKLAQSSISSTKECGTSTSIGTITEPDCLGPCEPGTSVTLEGIVWQETEGGILVVNVTWRGKTYVGALLDSTNHDWAPNRLCDSPASDIDSKANKGVRTKRIVTRSNGIGLDEKNLLQTTGKLRNGKGRRIITSNDLAPCNKRQRESEKSIETLSAQSEAKNSLANVSSIINSETACVPMNIDTSSPSNNESLSKSEISTDKAGPNSPMLIGCSEPNCSKKYRNMNGLLYHQTRAHGTESEPSDTRADSCSSSSKDKVEDSTGMDQTNYGDDAPADNKERLRSHSPEEQEENEDTKPFQAKHEKRRTPSPQLSLKISNRVGSGSSPNSNDCNINQELKHPMARSSDQEKRSSLNTNHSISGLDFKSRSPLSLPQLPPPPIPLQHQQQPSSQQTQQHHQQQQQPPPPLVGPPRYMSDHGHGSNSHSSSSKQNACSSNQINPAPLPVTTEEGMKPSGTSTGPPPAPHQANCYFNSAFLANTFNPYGAAIAPFFARPPLPMYDPLGAPTSTTNAALLSRFMNNMRVPPPADSPSRLLSPSMPKNSPFPQFKTDPGVLPVPTPHIAPIPPLPNLSPMPNQPPLASGPPYMRMPSQGDPILPPTSQPPFPRRFN